MNPIKKSTSKSYLDYLKENNAVNRDLTLEEAVEELTDELNCIECIALTQCADCYGQNTVDKENPRCKEVVRAFLSQDYKKKEEDK